MTNPMMYEQLDQAIGVMLGEPDGAVPALDAETRALLAVAAELRSLPRPDFRAALDAELRLELGLPVAKLRLNVVRKPVAVAPEVAMPTLFGGGPATYPVRPKNFFFSLGAHAAAAVLIIASTVFVAHQVTVSKDSVALVSPQLSDYQMPISNKGKVSGGGGGGGDRDKLAASAGRLPQMATNQLAPPSAVIRNEDPALAVTPTVVMPNLRVPQPNVATLGDPLAAIGGPPSNGTGAGGGIGSGSGGGVGSGNGAGVGPGFGGGIGGGAYRVGGGVSAPRAIYAPDPEYSEEARRAKYQGTVTLWVVIGPDGRPRDMKVVRPLGMGLDEKALEAVRRWKFEPSLKDGQPVAVQVNIEVNFRLY